jgi:dTDP-glucose 4,6-dehydratase
MKILVTGGAGFVGHHVIEHIWKTTDWDVVSLDRLDVSGTLMRLSDIETYQKYKSRLKIVHHDLKASLNEFVVKAIGDVDIILHIAAASHVDRSIVDPMSFALDNTIGTLNLLDYARIYRPGAKFLYFGTDEVFGPAPEGTAYTECDRYNSNNPYAASKAAAEEFCVAYANTYRMPMKITHTMNIFGERQHPEKYIPKTISNVMHGRLVTVHADKTKTIAGRRHYIHARNVASALSFILNTPWITGKAEKYNIVGEREVDNLELARLIADIVGRPLSYEMVDFHSSRPGHDLRYALNGQKLLDLGWKHPITFEESLKRTITWTIRHKDTWLLD